MGRAFGNTLSKINQFFFFNGKIKDIDKVLIFGVVEDVGDTFLKKTEVLQKLA
jgi:hypothetical protein